MLEIYVLVPGVHLGESPNAQDEAGCHQHNHENLLCVGYSPIGLPAIVDRFSVAGCTHRSPNLQ